MEEEPRFKFIPLAEFAPDSAEVNPGASDCICNVVPILEQEGGVVYAPFRGLSGASDPTPEGVKGAITFFQTAGEAQIVAGTESGLYLFNPVSGTWSNASDSGEPAGYNTPFGYWWEFASFGKYLLATNNLNRIQFANVSSEAVFAPIPVSADITRAKCLSVVKDFVVLGNTVDALDGERPQRLWWSSIGNPLSFPDPFSTLAAQTQSGFVEIPGQHGEIVAIRSGIGSIADAYVFFENAIYRLDYVGPPFVFKPTAAFGTKGTTAPKSIVQVGKFAYFLGEDGFYRFDGIDTVPIGDGRIDKFFMSMVNPGAPEKIIGSLDLDQKLIYWTFQSQNIEDPTKSDKILIYNYGIDKWSIINHVTDYIFTSRTQPYTLETIDQIASSLDAIPGSFDDPQYNATIFKLAGFDSEGRFGYFIGDALEPNVETGVITGEIGKTGYVTSMQPIYRSSDEIEPLCSIRYRDSLNKPYSETTPNTTGPDGFSPQRCRARYMKFSIKPNSDNWTQLRGVNVDYQVGGRR